MRKVHIVLTTVGGVLIGLSGYSYEPAVQAAEKAKTAPTDANGNNPVDNDTPLARRQKQVQQTPFYCFGDAACEREMARQGRPVADQKSKQRNDEGPYIDGIPGQTDGPGFGNTAVPVVPGK
jgi:hypothetical protein